MRQLLACLLLILPAAAFAGEVDADAASLITRTQLHGAVTVALADRGETILVAIDAGSDNVVDQVISLDLKGEPTEAVEFELTDATVYYVAKERRLQILAPAEGHNLLFGNEGAGPLADPGAALAATPIVHFVTGGLGVSTGWGDLSPAEAVEILRDAKAEAAAARKRIARASPPIVRGTARNIPLGADEPRLEGEGGFPCTLPVGSPTAGGPSVQAVVPPVSR